MRQRERDLEIRANALNQKEQELLLKEKVLTLKEEELQKREMQLDSTRVNDTSFIYKPALIGTWAVKMNCIETTCAGSAVGDSKTEQWNITYQNNGIIAKAFVGESLVRTYSGMYNGNALELFNEQRDTSDQTSVRMIVRLRLVDEKSMQGQREILREGICKIVYALQMNKQ
jgi:hypothetical protein